MSATACVESPVDSGNVYKHPFKRARTTGTYLAAATVGTDADRRTHPQRGQTMRINRCVRRRQVHCPTTLSTPNCSCGWRPACTGTTSTPTIASTAPRRRGRRRGVSRCAPTGHHAAGARKHVASPTGPRSTSTGSIHWTSSAIDPPVREYLKGVAALTFLPWPVRTAGRPVQPVRHDRLSARRVSAR